MHLHHRAVQLIVELSVNAAGQFEGTVDSGSSPTSEFSGTLELLKVLQDVTRADALTAEGSAR